MPQQNDGSAEDPDIDPKLQSELAREAVEWGFPLVLGGRYFAYAVAQDTPVNQFLCNDALATPKINVAGPNIDTLYGLAWVDLSAGPQVLQVPATQGRYYSIQFHGAWLSTFIYIGNRETGDEAGSYVFVPPGWVGEIPAGMTRIEAPDRRLFAMARTHVRNPQDEAAAAAVQAQFSLGALADFPGGRREAIVKHGAQNVLPAMDLTGLGADFFDELCALLVEFPPSRDDDRAALARYAAIGIAPGAKPSANPALAPLLAASVRPALEAVRNNNFFLENDGGWWVNNKVNGYSTETAAMRAAVNYFGPAWHLAQEALYYSTVLDADDERLSGSRNYQLYFPPGKLPLVEAFWSVTMYGAYWSLIENAIDRYAINDSTPGLVYDADGGLRLLIRHLPPAEGIANWLPAPAGEFMVFIRLYQPRPELLSGAYKMPRIEKA